MGSPGTDIPIEARIVACCDAYDAMTTDRAYRAALPVDVALTEIKRGAGKQFDPRSPPPSSTSSSANHSGPAEKPQPRQIASAPLP